MANTKKKNKDVQLSTGKKKTMKLEAVELKFLTPNERIQYLISNGHLMKDELFNVDLLKKVNLKKEALIRKPNKLNTKLKIRNKHIKYIDSILMNELLISQPAKDDKKRKSSGDNNNDTDLSDQNNSDSSKTIESETNAENAQVNSEVNAVVTSTNDSVSTGDQTTAIKTKKPKLIQNKTKSNNTDSEIIDISDDQTNSTKDAKSKKNKDKKITQKLQQMTKMKLSNGDALALHHFQCDHCQVTLLSKSSMQRHMLLHLNIKPFSCAHCPNRHFRQRGNWRVHMARNHPEAYEKMKYECKVCKKPFVLLEHLKLHQKLHANERRQRYTCVFCEKCFKDEALLMKHEKHHMAPGRYKCSMCSMSYDSRSLYSNHLKSHSQVHDYSCQFCSKSYLRPSSIARHIRVSHGGMRMQCPVCNKLLKGHLTEHMRTHENLRPHECDVCGQKFTQSTQLTVHKRSHTGDRPYPCRICKQPFSHSNALMLHIRRHTGEKPFECAMCPQTFSQLPHMKAHMRSIHNKTEFYKCNNCNTFFKLKTLLEAHAEECGEAENMQKTDKADGTLVSRMRFLLALLFTMIASKEKLNDLGFNKRLIDDILIDSVEAMGLSPCKDKSLTALPRLKTNVMMLLQGTVPKPQMALFVEEKKSTEEILELLTDDLNKK